MNKGQKRLIIGIAFIASQVLTYMIIQSVSIGTLFAQSIKGPLISWSGPNLVQNMTSTSITVSWRTEVQSKSVIYYGTSPDVKTMTTTSINENVIQHTVEITGLQPNTTYYYKVGDGKFFTPLYYFKTLPEDPDVVSFCVYGDTRPPDSRNKDVVALMAKRDPQFWLHVGDLVGAGGSMPQWDTFLDELRGLSEYSSFMPVIGNHEYYGESSGEPMNFYEIFALPGDESTFAFSVGDVLIMALNTRDWSKWTDGHAVKPEELAWANQTLAENYLKYKWILLYCHYPPFSTWGVDTKVVNDIKPLAERYDVDVVFTGHVHNYERFDVPNNQTGNTNITYFVTGGGGAPLDSASGSSDFSQAYFSQYQYLYCNITDTSMYVECVNLTESVIDNWTLGVKDRSTLNSTW
ncbi:MAG: fibronectin type III domain-containing protein [Promethearchaeota archaeon]